MRGNLVWMMNGNEVKFVPNELGLFEVNVLGNIQLYQNGESKQEQVESNPEKDYVIFAYKDSDGNVWELNNGTYKNEKFHGAIYPTHVPERFTIYHVQRTPDKAEFLVDEITEQGEIQQFGIIGNEMRVRMKIDMAVVGSGRDYTLKMLTKKKDKQKQSECNFEYTITAFKDKHGFVWSLTHDSYKGDIYSAPLSANGYSYEEIQKYKDNSGFEIYSVRRNSDSEEFFVEETTKQGRIKKFRNAYAAPDRMVIEMYERNGAIALTHLTKKWKQ